MAESDSKPTDALPEEQGKTDSTEPSASATKTDDSVPKTDDQTEKSLEAAASETGTDTVDIVPISGSKPATADTPSVPDEADGAKASDNTKLGPQHHVAKILDDVLEESNAAAAAPAFKHPMLLDLTLTIGLLLAVGGFMLGIMNMWIAHQAKEDIMHRNYKAAITVLRGIPFAGFFNVAGSDPAELLSQALYQEAMEKLDADDQDASAVEELGKIPPGSAFFDNAQEIVKEHSTASSVQLQGSAEHEATPSEAVEPPKPLLPPPENKDASP